MKTFFADKYSSIQMNAINAAADQASHTHKLINLSIGDHDVQTDSEVIEKALEDTKNGYTKYTHPLGLEELREAITELNHRKYGKALKSDEIMATVGACHGMVLALKAIINPEDEVIVIAPYFPIYEQQITDVEGVPVFVYTKEEDGFVPSIEAIKAKVTKQTKAIMINSPCNPTGVVLSREFLTELYALSKEKNFVILSDEVYTAFTFNEHTFVSMLEVDEDLTHTIILRSLSKDYAMTGWRLGYILAQAPLVAITRYINESITYSAPTVSQRAALAAIGKHDTITSHLQEIYEERLNTCYEHIQAIPELSVSKPQGSIYLFINVKGTGMTGSAFADNLLKEQGVLVLPGDIFGAEYVYCVRMACNQEIDVLEEAFERIKNYL